MRSNAKMPLCNTGRFQNETIRPGTIWRILFLLLITCSSFPFMTEAQQPVRPVITISGVVTDENNQPLSGATVTLTGTTTSTSTNEKGLFSIIAEIPSGSSVQITSVGFATQVLPIGNNTVFTIKMVTDATSLSDVVVIGYGVESRKKMVSSVSTVKTDKIVTLPFSNMADALAGRAAGVITQSSGGEPGTGFARIAIRGGSGPDGGEPLYVIDNIISSKYDFQNLLPQDVQDLSILKDGAATAVYGARASNGIVLVTTKKGQKGRVNINFSTLYELSSPIVLPKRINSYDYAVAQNSAAKADGRTTPPFSQGLLDTILNHKDPYTWPDNDWYGLALRKYTPQVKYALDLSGGNDKTNYFISLSAFNQGSNYKTDVSNFKRYNVRSSITQKFDRQGLTFGANLYGTFTNQRTPAAGSYGVWSHLQNSPPFKQAYNPDGTYAAGVDHPLVDIDPQSGYYKNDIHNLNGSVNLDWAIPWVKGLKASVLGYAKMEDGYTKTWTARAPQYDNLGILQGNPLPSLDETATRFNSYTVQARLDYSKSIGLHSVNVLALYEQSESKLNNLEGYRRDFMSPAVDQLFAGGSSGATNNGSAEEAGREGLVGRVKYDYAGKYILEGSFRYDGNDNFPKNARWGFFPSIAAGWVVSQEEFFRKHVNKNILSSLKIRYSVAKVGNDKVARFPYLSNYSLNQNVYMVNGSLVNGFSEGLLVDPNAVTWYDTKDYNTGVDFSTLKGKINGTVEYFYRRTTNFLTNPTSMYTTPLGANLPIIRSNSAFRRAGWEFTLNYNDKKGDFVYNIGGNLTLYNELWERRADETDVTLKNPMTRTTHETDYWGVAYLNNGYYQDVNSIINTPRRVSSTQLVPGDIAYRDINGDGKLDGSDQVRTGRSSFPHLVYGINMSLAYKAFSIDMLWQGTGSRSAYLGGTLTAPVANSIVYDYQKDFWTPENPGALYPRQTLVNAANNNNNYTTSDFWLYDAKYLRLKSLRLAFDVKKQFARNLSFLNSCLITLNGTNLLTFSPVKKFFDPETSDQSNYGYPTQKVYSLGVTVGF